MNTTVKSIALGAGGLFVAVTIYLLGGATAANYPSAILHHLIDRVNGSVTSTAVVTNSPAWAIGEPLAQPISTTIATSSHADAASGLASSTPYTFAIAALDGYGTTTLSDPLSITTDASTTQAKPEDILIKWAAVPGATGYAIFFATSSSATTYSQYFYATTTGQFDFSTSTGALPGADTLTVGTAMGVHLNQNGRSWINNSTTATSTPVASTTAFQVGGGAAFVAPATTTACTSETAGTVFFNLANKREWGCNGTAWTAIF